MALLCTEINLFLAFTIRTRKREGERGEREERGGETDPSLSAAWGSDAKAKFWYPSYRTRVGSFAREEKNPHEAWIDPKQAVPDGAVPPCVHAFTHSCRCIQRSHETRRLSEGPPPSLAFFYTNPLPPTTTSPNSFTCKMKTVAKWWREAPVEIDASKQRA